MMTSSWGICDNGTNFVSALNKELYNNLGITMRTSTPLHPEGNSLVERFNQSLKNMIKVIIASDKPRDWDLQLKYMLWAYREIPNDTTGISPFQMVYGHTARGPLAVLKDSWSNAYDTQISLNKTVKQYLDELHENFNSLKQISEVNNDKNVNKSNLNYNKISKPKCFEIGELVLILLPSSTNKLKAQWQGPVSIVDKVSENSYLVNTLEGGKRVLHANDLRRYNLRVESVGVAFENEEDFGNIPSCPLKATEFEVELNSLDLQHLNETQKQEILQVLRNNEKAFNNKPGTCSIGEHAINLYNNVDMPKIHIYRVPEKFKSEVDKQIQVLLEDGKIRESSSPYAHPLVCVTKRNGEVRVCTDLRMVNSITVPDAFPIPNPEDLLNKISPSKYITTLDCTSGYWQIRMKESDCHKTAFQTHRGLYEWLVMPFGVKTASATFQRVMMQILEGYQKFASAYIDDCACHSMSWKSHLEHLDRVLKRFISVGMTLKLAKCRFALPEVEFIGHVVGSGKKRPQLDKVKAIRDIPVPVMKKQLRSFLGLCSFYRGYVRNFADIAASLTDLTKAGGKNSIVLNAEQLKAFEEVKSRLSDTVGLNSPDFTLPFIIRTDSSDFAVGASISQTVGGVEVPIAFASAKLSSTQQRWATIEREAYAIIYALKKFEHLILGHKVHLFTDHNPLQYMTSCTPKSSKLIRWALSLSRYDLEIKHISGKLNVVSDCLSRV